MTKRWYVLVDTGECVFTSTRRRAIEKLRLRNPSLVVDETNVFYEAKALLHEKHLAAVQSSTEKGYN